MIEHLLSPLVCERFKVDERYRDGHLRVINALPQRRVLGLHAPLMKHLAKMIYAGGAMAVLPDGSRNCTNGAEVISSFEEMSIYDLNSSCDGGVPYLNLCYEETVIWGFLINLEKGSVEKRLAMLERYVPVMDNWAVCDFYCANAKWVARADKELIWAFLQRWFDSDREFEVRFAVVASMCYFLCEEWLERVFERIGSIDFDSIKSKYRSVKGKPKVAQEGTVQGAEPYYVRMGVAWLLATALAKFPEQTRKFASSSALPPDVIKLYVRKARESFRTRGVTPIL